MKHVKTLTLAFALMFVLATAALAGETSSPPCTPGETSGPPCAVQPLNEDPAGPGETSTPPVLPVVAVTDIAEMLLWSLLLF